MLPLTSLSGTLQTQENVSVRSVFRGLHPVPLNQRVLGSSPRGGTRRSPFRRSSFSLPRQVPARLRTKSRSRRLMPSPSVSSPATTPDLAPFAQPAGWLPTPDFDPRPHPPHRHHSATHGDRPPPVHKRSPVTPDAVMLNSRVGTIRPGPSVASSTREPTSAAVSRRSNYGAAGRPNTFVLIEEIR